MVVLFLTMIFQLLPRKVVEMRKEEGRRSTGLHDDRRDLPTVSCRWQKQYQNIDIGEEGGIHHMPNQIAGPVPTSCETPVLPTRID